MDDQNYVNVPPPAPLVQNPQSASGLSDNSAAALAYITIIPAILFLVLAPFNQKQFIRFNAFQCLAMSVFAFVLHFLMIIPILGWLVVILGDLALLVAWVLCIVNASQGKLFKVPVLGDIAENLSKNA